MKSEKNIETAHNSLEEAYIEIVTTIASYYANGDNPVSDEFIRDYKNICEALALMHMKQRAYEIPYIGYIPEFIWDKQLEDYICIFQEE